MIALPFAGSAPPPAGFKFRVMMNQYSETLVFDFIDEDVPNRGLSRNGNKITDQKTSTVDYQQAIKQVAATDWPDSGLAGLPGDDIHHEPGLWLFDTEKSLLSKADRFNGEVATEIEVSIARLASIPHGNSVLALGNYDVQDGMPVIPKLSGLSMGRFPDPTDPYLDPYKHFISNPFMGNVTAPGFPGFSPTDMNELLREANKGVNIARTTTLSVDSTIGSGGISSVPFSKREADPVTMKSTFWIQELAEKDDLGQPLLRLQYSQVVMMNFFAPRGDGLPERAAWPHISIATLDKVVDKPTVVEV